MAVMGPSEPLRRQARRPGGEFRRRDTFIALC